MCVCVCLFSYYFFINYFRESDDELNGCFTRYDRHMKNRQAAAQNGGNETSFTEPSAALPPPVVSKQEKLLHYLSFYLPSLPLPPSLLYNVLSISLFP